MNQDYLEFYSDEWPRTRFIPVPIDKSKTPLDAMTTLLYRTFEEKQAMHEESRAYRKLFVKIVLDIYNKRKFEYAKTFRSILSLIEQIGLKIITYEGAKVTSELMEIVDIIEWLPPDNNRHPVVVEAFEPEIRIGNRVYHTAKLICRNADERAKSPAGATKKHKVHPKARKSASKTAEKTKAVSPQNAHAAAQNTNSSDSIQQKVKEIINNENQ